MNEDIEILDLSEENQNVSFVEPEKEVSLLETVEPVKEEEIEKNLKIIKKEKKTNGILKRLLLIIFKLIFVAIIIVILFSYVFGFHIQKGLAMYPKIVDNDLLFYYRLDKNYHTNDVVVVKVKNKEYALRVVALANDVIDIDEDNNLRINGHEITEDIFYATEIKEKIKFPYTVPANEVFLLGDYRTNSVDSRDFSSVNINNIKGKVINILRSRDI